MPCCLTLPPNTAQPDMAHLSCRPLCLPQEALQESQAVSRPAWAACSLLGHCSAQMCPAQLLCGAKPFPIVAPACFDPLPQKTHPSHDVPIRRAILPPTWYAPPAPKPPMMVAAPTLLPMTPVTAVAAAALPPTVLMAVPVTAAMAGAARPPAGAADRHLQAHSYWFAS